MLKIRDNQKSIERLTMALYAIVVYLVITSIGFSIALVGISEQLKNLI